MNIEKLAKHLKEFTLDEIEMIAECDCKTELEKLLNSNKIVFEQGVYKYIENITKEKFGIFIEKDFIENKHDFEEAINIFMKQYVKKYCKKGTIKTYHSLFKTNILPFFINTNLANITKENITNFYYFCMNKNLSARRVRNTFALLKQFLKYFKNRGCIKTLCNFQVKRLSNKNKFNINRIIFED